MATKKTMEEKALVIEKAYHQLNDLDMNQPLFRETVKQLQYQFMEFIGVEYCENRFMFESYFMTRKLRTFEELGERFL